MDDKHERDLFELAFATGHAEIDANNYHRGGQRFCPDHYTHDRIQALWEGWLKRAEVTPPNPTANAADQ